MKKSWHLALICLVSMAFICCRKEIPSNDLGYIGTWECQSCGTGNSKILVILPDGYGKYEAVSSGSDYHISGNITFDGNNFRIGSIVKKKFTTDKYPYKEITLTVPYQYTWTARFNGDDYLKTKE